jgi:carbon monoxide dehydrogenase subunit G
MATIEKSIVIHATTEQIDRYALDASTWPQWFAGVEAVDADGTFPEPGGVVDTTYKSMGATFHLTITSQDLEIGSHVVFEMTGMITGTQNWHYEPEGNATRVVCTFDYDLPGGGLGKALDKVLFQRTNSQSIEESLDNLKALVEG